MKTLIAFLGKLPGKKILASAFLAFAFSMTPVAAQQTGPAQLPTAVQAAATAAKPAPLGRRFIVGAKSPQDIAELLRCDRDAARGGNPYGIKIINIKACGRPGMVAYASPNDLVVMLQIADPNEHVTFDNLPAYLDTLKEIKGDNTRYRSACLKQTTLKRSPTGWMPEMNCNVREPEPGENVWVNPKTLKVVFLQNCTNPVSGPEKKKPCGTILFYGSSTVTRIAETGPRHFESECWKLERPNDVEAHSPWQDRCPNVTGICDGSDIEQAFGVEVQRIGSFASPPGWYILTVPFEFTEVNSPWRVFFCLEEWDLSNAPAQLRDDPQGMSQDEWVNALLEYANPYAVKHSISVGVRGHDYLRNRFGEMVATIYTSEQHATSNKARTRVACKRTTLYWVWDNPDWQALNDEADRCDETLSK